MKKEGFFYTYYVNNQECHGTFIPNYSVIYREGDLPSIIKYNHNKQMCAVFYFNKGMYHRTTGPAMLYYDPVTQEKKLEIYYLYNKEYKKEDFEDELFKIRLNQLENETK